MARYLDQQYYEEDFRQDQKSVSSSKHDSEEFSKDKSLKEFQNLAESGDFSQVDFYLESFLSAIDFEDLIGVLKRKNVNFFQFISSSDQDLYEMGIQSSNVRATILRELKRFHMLQIDYALTMPRQESEIDGFTMSDAVTIGANVCIQLEMLKRLVIYLRKKCENGPLMLLPMEEDCQYSTVLKTFALRCQLQSRNIDEELSKLVDASTKLQSKDEFFPADLLAEWMERRKKYQKSVFQHPHFKYYASAIILTGTMFLVWRKIRHIPSF